jgi:hypothetical protein
MTRTRGDYLNAREVQRLRQAFDDNIPTSDIADELNCTTRTASKYYARFRGAPLPHGRPKNQPRIPAAPQDRFYKSNFEI